MGKFFLRIVSPPRISAACVSIFLLAGCASVPADTPASTPGESATAAIPPTSPPRTPTLTATPTLSPTATKKWPLTVVFYGDSLLKIGEVGRQGKSGFSFVDDLRKKLDSEYALILANYGGRGAKWAFENLDRTVLTFSADSVTIWWGFNDLLGCPGFFDPTTNALIQEKLDWLLRRHIEYLKKQIDALLGKGVSVLIFTAVPVDGWLPWTHFDEKNNLVWELDHRCDYNIGLKRQAEEERSLVEGYRAEEKSVYLVDAWRIFEEHHGMDGMYVDIMHPGSTATDLIAEEWIRVFAQTGALIRRR